MINPQFKSYTLNWDDEILCDDHSQDSLFGEVQVYSRQEVDNWFVALAASRAPSQDVVAEMVTALEACVALYTSPPRKFDEAMTWISNDDKVRALVAVAIKRGKAKLAAGARAVPVQEEKQHDAIGRSVHAAGNVGMCNCDTCRLPTRNLLEIGSIPNVTTGQPQRVFVEWPSSAISVPAVPVQDAPAPICKDCLLHTGGELTWLEYCPKHQPFPAVQDTLTTLADRIEKELKLWGGPHPLITLLNESEAALRRAAGGE